MSFMLISALNKLQWIIKAQDIWKLPTHIMIRDYSHKAVSLTKVEDGIPKIKQLKMQLTWIK